MKKGKLGVDIVFSDLDDTLVYMPGGMKTTPLNKRAIWALKEAGKKFVVSTGRSFERAKEIAEELKTDYVISSNGGVVISLKDKKVVNLSLITFSHLECFFDVPNLTSGLFFVFYCVDSQDMLNDFYWGRENSEFLKTQISLKGYKRMTNLHTLKGLRVFQVNVFGPNSDLKVFSQHLEKTGHFLHIFNYPHVLEVNAKNVSKGSAALFLLQKLQISPDRSLAFGDGKNDVSIFQTVKYGIAVANAVSELKKVAFAQTDSWSDSGVGNFLFKWVIESKKTG